jgi:fatty-acid desaturase
MSGPATIERARSIVEDLLDLRAEARAWARAHRAHHPRSTMTEAHDDPPYVCRREYLEATRRLLAAIDATGEP